MVLLRLLRYKEADQSLQMLGRSLQQKPQTAKQLVLSSNTFFRFPVTDQLPPPQSSRFVTFWPNPRQQQNCTWAEPGPSFQIRLLSDYLRICLKVHPQGAGKGWAVTFKLTALREGRALSRGADSPAGWVTRTCPSQGSPALDGQFLGPALSVSLCQPQAPWALSCQNNSDTSPPPQTASICVCSITSLIADQVRILLLEKINNLRFSYFG